MDKFHRIIKLIERVIIISLVVLMAIVLVLSTAEVAVIVVAKLSNPLEDGGVFIDITGLMDIFGFFLIVLIGFELFETVKWYLKENFTET